MTQNIPVRSPSKTLASKAGFALQMLLTISQLREYWEENGKLAQVCNLEGIQIFLSKSN